MAVSASVVPARPARHRLRRVVVLESGCLALEGGAAKKCPYYCRKFDPQCMW